MTSISKKVHIDKLDDIINTYNNTYHNTIKTKPVDVKPSTYIESSKEITYQYPKFKIGDKNIFAKGYVANWSEEVFVIKEVKNTVPWTCVIIHLKGEEIVGMFFEKELHKTNQSEFRVEKAMKRKGDKLFVKWKDYDNSCNSWIDKKYSINKSIFSKTKIFRNKGES